MADRAPRVAVVGGGPAGLMAAETLANAGMAVTIYDRMASVARKFLLAGRGGLNLTHSEPLEPFLARYGPIEPRLREFLRYLLSREGQAMIVRDGGYLPLNPGAAAQQRKKLE